MDPAPASTFPPAFLHQGSRLRTIFLLPVRIFHVELGNHIRSHVSPFSQEGIVPTAVAKHGASREKPSLLRRSLRFILFQFSWHTHAQRLSKDLTPAS